LRRRRCPLIALQPDVPDTRVGHELQHPGEHPEPGAKHGHQHDIDLRAASSRRAQRRLDRSFDGGEIAKRFGGQKHAHSPGELPESLWRCPHIAQLQHDVLHDGVFDQVYHA
jgi:hypothetical protein